MLLQIFFWLCIAPVVLAGNIPRQTSAKYEVKTPPLDTKWTYELGTNPWPEYPRPQLQRSEWLNLNGVWNYQNASSLDSVNSPPFNQTLSQEVLVPSCLESGISGIQGEYTLYSWYSTRFNIPANWRGKNVLLNFAAVDYEATVFINGREVGFNRGGYFRFAVDATPYANFGGSNELLVFVHDPTDSGDYVIPIGKQTLRPSHIFYRPCSGIWQSVWIENAPANHIEELDITADMNGQVSVTAHTVTGNFSISDLPVEISLYEKGSQDPVSTHTGKANQPFNFTVPSPKLWSPNSPTLYNITVKMGTDTIQSYTGFRTISMETIDNIVRPTLNGDFIFQFGTLDQGYWPDGLYTPPNKEAMVYDLEVLKEVGFNMVRKHIKVEPALFYQACDEMGLLVIQDMPSLRPLQNILPNQAQQDEFTRQLQLLINQHKNYPSISTWVIYNEGWGQIIEGQYPEFGLTDLVRQLDPTRLIDSTSGWFDHGAGDYSDNHHYANPQCGTPFYSIQSPPFIESRIAIQGEFGGLGQNVSIDHLWNVQQAINAINQTYENHDTIESWRYRSHLLLSELKDQVEMYSCSGGVWTQTTDVEGEVNGLITYDREIKRYDDQWKRDVQALYDAAAARVNGTTRLP